MKANAPHDAQAQPALLDANGRPLHDLRISLTDRCNMRCNYCMPADRSYSFLPNDERLSLDEYVRLAGIFVKLGVKKIRLTGGEPLLFNELPDLIAGLSELPGLEDIAITSNALLLASKAQILRDSGLNRLTLSLDALDEKLAAEISGGKFSLPKFMRGLWAAKEAGFEQIKINSVIKKGMNEDQLLPLAQLACDEGLAVRFIEFMDVGNCNEWQQSDVITAAQMQQELSENFTLKALDSNYFGEVARRYQITDAQGKVGEIGFITSVSDPFCGDCTRARLSCDGRIFGCLFAARGRDLKSLMREGLSDDQLIQVICQFWQQRSNRYSEERDEAIKSGKRRDIIEMFQIGG